MNDINAPAAGISRRNVLKVTALGGVGLAGAGLLAACATDAGAPGTTSPAPGTTSAAPGTTSAAPSSSAPATTGLLVAHLIANVPAFESTNRAFNLAAEALGNTSQFTSYDGDMQKALSQSLTFKALSAAGVFSYLVADGQMPAYAQNLTKDGIAFQGFSNRIPWFDPGDAKFDGKLIGILQGPFAEEAYIMAKTLFERGGGKGKAIRLRGPKGGLSDDARGKGVDLALKEYPGVEVVGEAYTDWDPTKGQKALETLLPQNPDVKFIITMNDGLALGALATLKTQRNTTAILMGCDGDPGFLEAMQKEERLVGTSAGLIAFTGALAATRLFDAINGVKFHPLEAFVDTDSVIIDTKEAAAELLNLTGEDKPLLWDVTKMSRAINGDAWTTQHHLQVGNPSTFEWGDKPGTTPTPRPAGFTWTAEYQAALDAGEIDTLNAEWDKRFVDPYTAVREKATRKEGSLGEFKRKGII